MIAIRRSHERGRGEHGWLHARHSFSFAGYFDPKNMGYRSLRVINEDVIDAGGGFGTHPHDNMEIVTWVLEGELAHADSMGRKETLRPGMAQFMSAGSGVTHSEFNGSREAPVHLLQIWIVPAERDTKPHYEDRDFAAKLDGGGLVTILSPDGRDGSLAIGQDATLGAARLKTNEEVSHDLAAGRGAWVQVARGSVSVNGTALEQGDAAVVEDERAVRIVATEDAEVLVFDLA